MKGKIAFVLGAATGYVLGTRAGRERYEQIKRAAKSAWATGPVQSGVTAVKSAVGDRVEAAQQAVIRGGKDLFITVIRLTEKTAGSATSGSSTVGSPTSGSSTVGSPTSGSATSGSATSNSTVVAAAEAATTKARTPQATPTKATPTKATPTRATPTKTTPTKATPADIASAQKASTTPASRKTEPVAGTADTNEARPAKADATES